MIKKTLVTLVVLVAVVLLVLQAIGAGWFGSDWSPDAVVKGPRAMPAAAPEAGTPQILFGDLHNHTNYSLDAYLFSTGLVKDSGVVTPADACDFARYCSSLDFWSINDHAESLTPRVWADTLDVIRQCNANAGDPANPDMVAFAGWEWSQSDFDDIPSHYGHKNVIFRTWEEGAVPTRPIASQPVYLLARIPAIVTGLMSFADSVSGISDFGRYAREARNVPPCDDSVAAPDLPDDCREVALTPADLYRKLDEWGYDALVIPHGLSWGTTNPVGADFRNQLDQHEQRYQKLLEVYSGHGNSEVFEDFLRIGVDDQGNRFCPPATEHFEPCCQRAQVLAREQCEASGADGCDAYATEQLAAFLEKGDPAGRKLFPDNTQEDWAGCGHLRDSFQPSAQYLPRQSAQYTLALGYDAERAPARARFGLIGSSDGHQARPGASYKEANRVLYTDSKEVGRAQSTMDFYRADSESAGFYYTGGLVAAHTEGRDRNAIWRALHSRNVYATSGDRMLVWFDLLNGPTGEVPMGSQVVQRETPRFRVKALGAFEQVPGCPDYAVAALGEERARSLCGGECYRPGDKRKAISRIEIVRIRPQLRPDEPVSSLIEDTWKVFDCSGQENGCTAQFVDLDYMQGDRPALYYARVIQAAEPLINGDPFGCERDASGACTNYTYCRGEVATRDNNCLAESEPRAWTSPIFLEHPGGAAQ